VFYFVYAAVLVLHIFHNAVWLSVCRLSHLRTLLKPFDGLKSSQYLLLNHQSCGVIWQKHTKSWV